MYEILSKLFKRDKIPRGAKVSMRNNNVIQRELAQAEVRVSSAWGHLLRSLEDITEAVRAAATSPSTSGWRSASTRPIASIPRWR